MKIVSNIFFISAVVLLIGAIIFFEVGLRSMRKRNLKKQIASNKLGWRLLFLTGVSFALSALFAYFA
ncbi:hypothetical protein JYK00_02330 [Thermosipho ferrireducens]|uniref:Uncharacterized protein n=1 Tax=Thermosipho ferrireducens TaxID=2571116 RepID=A0ABX7S708_9BACT|nr:hypothetical protein [Thermosipho ferrireducens]QTA38382.1 hypothetical protein JYK00_02330 [Thermosipho ferrireducens]